LEKERAVRGKYLRKDNHWTEKFKKITDHKGVEVFYDNGIKRYLLYLNGRFNMELGRSVVSDDIAKAREHFKRLRSGSRYEMELKQLKELDHYEEKAEQKFEEDFGRDLRDDEHYILRSPTSFVVNGRRGK
jgi:hypothetical protein